MKTNSDRHIERITDKILKEASLESPSLDFTTKVMSQVQGIALNDVTTYKPLISKPVWIGIAVLFIGALAYSFFGSATESEWLATIDLSILSDNKLTNALTGLSFSKTILYAAVMFAIMFAVQVPILKGYFDKRLSV